MASIEVGLYNADTEELIAIISEGSTVDPALIAGIPVTISATVKEDGPLSGKVESMKLDLNDGQATRTENVEPYALFGDKNGDYNGLANLLNNGENNISFDLFAGNSGYGALLEKVSINFSVSEENTNNTPPEAMNDGRIYVSQDDTVAVDVLANDVDADGDALTIVGIEGETVTVGSAIQLASGALATLQDDGTILYDPNGAFDGLLDSPNVYIENRNDRFTYTISDGNGGVDEARAYFDIYAVQSPDNHAPVVTPLEYFITEGETDGLFDLLAGATDPDGDELVAQRLWTEDGLALFGGNIAEGYGVSNDLYTVPDENSTLDIKKYIDDYGNTFFDEWRGVFDYIVTDGDVAVGTSITIHLVKDNDAPTASDQILTVDQDQGETLFFTLDAQDPDDLDEELTIEITSDPQHGTLAAVDELRLKYTPDEGYTGPDSFTYKVTDPFGLSSETATVQINPVETNQAPITAPISVSTDEDTVLEGVLPATDPDGDPLTFSLESDASHGTVVVNADGSASYTPEENFNGTDSFTYSVNDGKGGEASETVSITVNPVNDAPEVTPLVYSVKEGETDGLFNLLAGATDPDGDGLFVDGLRTEASLAYVWGRLAEEDLYDNDLYTVPDENGNIDINKHIYESFEDGNTLFDEWHGTFNYFISDGDVAIRTSLTIDFVKDNDAPIASDQILTVDQDQGENLSFTLDAYDPDDYDEELTIEITSDTQHGTLSKSYRDLEFKYTPDEGYTGPDSFTYKVTDPFGLSDTATVQFNPVDDEPSTGFEVVLIDSYTEEVITTLSDGQSIDKDLIEGRSLTISATVLEDSDLFGKVESVRLDLNDGQSTRTENVEPYALFGDRGGNFFGRDNLLEDGENSISFDLFSADKAKGELLDSLMLNFTIEELPESDTISSDLLVAELDQDAGVELFTVDGDVFDIA